jgi:OOP family OmpA-OmpF porin
VGGRAVGEADLMVPTPDGEREPRNRRVTVTIE